MDYDAKALSLHEQNRGKISLQLRDTGTIDREKLSAYYSPGVAAVCRAIKDDPKKLAAYTWTNNLVAVISDGSAVLGLGDIGPRAGMPVMEGKSLFFKHFADIDSVPIVLDVHTPEAIIDAVTAIAPSFGAINLEDIAAPKCFEIEDGLKERLSIPIMHDDQHGTAIITLAGLINASKITGRDLKNSKIVVVGSGAAGTAIIKLLSLYGCSNLTAVDSKGVINAHRTDLNSSKQALLSYLKPSDTANMSEALAEADIFIGVSQAGLLTPDHIKTMASRPIIFALANPIPEIMPDLAKKAGAAIVATGRSDLPNQVNNAVAFPGIFRGALDNNVSAITDTHKLAAATIIANLVENPHEDMVIPSVFDDRLVPSIAQIIV